jgi:hypothetical protein
MKVLAQVLALCVSASAFTAPLQANVKPSFLSASKFWTMDTPETLVQGGALRTWEFPQTDFETIYLDLCSDGPPEGNPLKATVELKSGQDNTPHKVDVYTGKGRLRPFKLMIKTPGSDTNSVFVRNIHSVEYDFTAKVSLEMQDALTYQNTQSSIVQGDSVRSFHVPEHINFVKCILSTNGRPMYAMVELVQTPNAPKYTLDIYSEDGSTRQFCTVMETPGAGNIVRIVNKATQEFPLTATVSQGSL